MRYIATVCRQHGKHKPHKLLHPSRLLSSPTHCRQRVLLLLCIHASNENILRIITFNYIANRRALMFNRITTYRIISLRSHMGLVVVPWSFALHCLPLDSLRPLVAACHLPRRCKRCRHKRAEKRRIAKQIVLARRDGSIVVGNFPPPGAMTHAPVVCQPASQPLALVADTHNTFDPATVEGKKKGRVDRHQLAVRV